MVEISRRSFWLGIVCSLLLLVGCVWNLVIQFSSCSAHMEPAAEGSGSETRVEAPVDWRFQTGEASVHDVLEKDENGYYRFSSQPRWWLTAGGALQDVESENCITGLLDNFNLNTAAVPDGDYGLRFTTLDGKESHWMHLGKRGESVQLSVSDVPEDMR